MRNREKIGKLIAACLIVSSATFVMKQTAQAGTTGKIAGKVTDIKTGEPLPGANVIIEGSTLGAATDVEGDYFILNVPPRIYTVKASMMGYDALRKTGVQVSIDQTNIVNFALSPSVIEMGEVMVVAERPVIQADIASSMTVLEGNQIAAMPVAQFKEVLDKQVGIREADARGLFVRGEREYGVSLRIDGLETRDHVDNQIETRINPDEVQEANVLTGGFSAEYGEASSGVVNVMLKEGGDTYEATFDGIYCMPLCKHFGPPLKYYYDVRFDNMEHWQALANDPSKMTGVYAQFLGKPELLRELYRWRMRDEVTKYGDKPDLNFRGTFGGPVPFLKNTTFFLSGRNERTYYLFNQAQPYYENLGFTGKITSQIAPHLKIAVFGRYVELSGINRYDRSEAEMSLGLDRLNDPSQTRENRYVFETVEDIAWTASAEQAHLSPWPYADKMSISNRFKNQWGLKLTHTLSSKTFYDVSLMYNTYRIYGGPPALRDTTQTVILHDDQGNTAILRGEYALAPAGYWFNAFSDPLGMGSANLMGGTHGNYERSRDKTFTARANLISQINKVNQINAGFELTHVDLLKHERREGSDNKFYEWKWHVYPKTVGLWLQDKLEFQGMIANVGVRADIRIPHDTWMNLKNNRYDYHWSSFFREGYLAPDSISAGPFYQPPVKFVLSPRISISHPIGTAAKIFFNYAHQNQNPPYEYQYRFEIRSDLQGGDIFGDPELPFIRTVQYEVGYEQNIAEVFFAAVSGYYRDVNNKLDLLQYTGDPHTLGERFYVTSYSTYAPDLYSSARGLEIRLEKRAGKFWTGRLNYDYEIFTSGLKGFQQFFENPTREPNERNRNIYQNLNRKLTPMPRLNLGMDLHTPARFGPGFGTFRPLADMRLSLLFWWRAQPTFTYNPERLAPPYEPRDNKRWKSHHATNLTFSKCFDFGAMVVPILYVQIYNLFNTKNMFRGAFTDAQREAYVKLLEQHGGSPGERQDLALQVLANEPEVQGPGTTPYDLYLNPRQMLLGFRLEFK